MAADYPEDVLKAAREAVAKVWDSFSGEDAADDEYCQEMAELCRAGEWDQQIEVQSACIAIMAERQRCAEIAESYRNTEGLYGRSVASDIKRAIMAERERVNNGG